MPKTALITGFETFGKYLTNPTKWLAFFVDGKTIAGHKIYSLIFPLAILLPESAQDFGEMIIKTALKIKARVILSFGMSSVVKGFRLERTATNWIENKKYCLPYENRRPINPIRPAKEKKKINLKYWDLAKIKHLFQKADIPYEAQISDDPGQYSCNALIYRTLLAMEAHKIKIPYLFVHNACTKEAIELIADFPYDKKITIKRKDMLSALKIFLQSYKDEKRTNKSY